VTLAYVDTSYMVAIAFAEPGYEALVGRLEASPYIFSSNLLEAELRSALRREDLTEDPGLLGSIAWVLPDRRLSGEIAAVLHAGYPRGADLWHLACALYLSPNPAELSFLTLDESQAAVAAAIGFPT
jgi:uncharacterized protein with PIN domain